MATIDLFGCHFSSCQNRQEAIIKYLELAAPVRVQVWPFQFPDVVQSLQVRRNASVNAEDPVGHQCSNRHHVESLAEGLPQMDIVPPFALVIETINPTHGCIPRLKVEWQAT